MFTIYLLLYIYYEVGGAVVGALSKMSKKGFVSGSKQAFNVLNLRSITQVWNQPQVALTGTAAFDTFDFLH